MIAARACPVQALAASSSRRRRAASTAASARPARQSPAAAAACPPPPSMPPRPLPPPILRISLAMAPPLNCFIVPCICSNSFSRRFIYLNAGASGDAALARGFQQLGFTALLRRHAVDDAFLALDVLLGARRVGVGRLAGDLAGQLVHQAAGRAHLLHLLQLAGKSCKSKPLPLLTLSAASWPPRCRRWP